MIPHLPDDRTPLPPLPAVPPPASLPYAAPPMPAHDLPDPDVCWAATVACAQGESG